MQKYQNFLVKAGRQCWPGDASDTSSKVSSRPHDVKADQWVANIVEGGLESGTGQTGASFQYNQMSDFAFSFTDSAGLSSGFYKKSDRHNLEEISSPFEYKN